MSFDTKMLKEKTISHAMNIYNLANNPCKKVKKMMKQHMELAGVKKIRVHDLGHSHVAYLIHEGVEPLLIKNRLGHKDIRITLNTYGHLYPNEQKKLAEMLNTKR